MKKSEIFLDTKGDFLYYIGARVWENFAQNAMKWEIASEDGNFHRVCPVIGRLRTEILRVDLCVYRRKNGVFGRQNVGLFPCLGMIHTA